MRFAKYCLVPYNKYLMKPIKENSPTNAIGISSTTHGTGNIDTHDLPFLHGWHSPKKRKPLKRFKDINNGKAKTSN